MKAMMLMKKRLMLESHSRARGRRDVQPVNLIHSKGNLKCSHLVPMDGILAACIAGVPEQSGHGDTYPNNEFCSSEDSQMTRRSFHALKVQAELPRSRTPRI